MVEEARSDREREGYGRMGLGYSFRVVRVNFVGGLGFSTGKVDQLDRH